MTEATDLDREAAEHEALCAGLPDGHHLRQWASMVTAWIQRWREERWKYDLLEETLSNFATATEARITGLQAEVERKGVLSVSRAELERLIAERDRLRTTLRSIAEDSDEGMIRCRAKKALGE